MLIGTLPQPITSAPLVILIYAVLILLIASALASVLLRNVLYAIGSFAAGMVLVAILYLTIAPFLLFAVQLLVFTTASAGILLGLLRLTSGFERDAIGPFSPEWIVGAAVSAAFLALLGVVTAVTNWPVRACCSIAPDFGQVLANGYVVGLWTIVILLASAALGCGLLLGAPALPSPRGGGTERPAPRGGRKIPEGDAP